MRPEKRTETPRASRRRCVDVVTRTAAPTVTTVLVTSGWPSIWTWNCVVTGRLRRANENPPAPSVTTEFPTGLKPERYGKGLLRRRMRRPALPVPPSVPDSVTARFAITGFGVAARESASGTRSVRKVRSRPRACPSALKATIR
jgi:hypothetical protein